MAGQADHGISLPEVIIGLLVTLVAFAGFAVLVTSVTVNQRNSEAQIVADTLLQEEIAIAKTYTFDDVMQAPPDLQAAPTPCPLNGNSLRVSTQAISPLSTVVQSGITYTIQRQVVWFNSRTPVTCDATPNLLDDIKVVNYTITWQQYDGETAERTGTLYVSPETGQGTPVIT